MFTLASLRSDWWTTCPELVDDFIGIRNFGSWSSEDGEAYAVGATIGAAKVLKHYGLLPAKS